MCHSAATRLMYGSFPRWFQHVSTHQPSQWTRNRKYPTSNATEVPIPSANPTHRIALPPDSKSKRSSISPVFGSATFQNQMAVMKFVENPPRLLQREKLPYVPYRCFSSCLMKGPFAPFWEDAAMKGISFEPSRKLWELPSKFFHVTMFFLYLIMFLS